MNGGTSSPDAACTGASVAVQILHQRMTLTQLDHRGYSSKAAEASVKSGIRSLSRFGGIAVAKADLLCQRASPLSSRT